MVGALTVKLNSYGFLLGTSSFIFFFLDSFDASQEPSHNNSRMHMNEALKRVNSSTLELIDLPPFI